MLLTDNPIDGLDRDRFGFAYHAKVLCDAVSTTTELPLTVAVYGAWGAGKSSFIRICHSLLSDTGMPVITFNPWKYDQREEVWHALIQTILNEISQQIDEDPDANRRAMRASVRHKAAALSRTAAWLVARRAVVPLSAGLVTADDLDAVRDAWSTRAAIEYRHVNHFEEDFAAVVEEFTAGGRLAVLIDDLDRCSPEAAVTVLDSLKLFLGQSSCVFVLAMDQEMIVDAVARRFEGNREYGRRYLEKLVQLPFHLPYVTYEAMYSHLADQIVGLGNDVAVWELIRVAYGQNPRQVRRFINTLNMAILSLRLHSKPSRERMVHAAMLITLRLQHPDFFAAIRQNAAVWQWLLKAADGSANPDSPPAPAGIALLVESFSQDAALLRLLAATSPRRSGFAFPVLPNEGEIEILTQVIAVGGQPPGSGSPPAHPAEGDR